MLTGWCGSVECVEDCRLCGYLMRDEDEQEGGEDDGYEQELDDCD